MFSILGGLQSGCCVWLTARVMSHCVHVCHISLGPPYQDRVSSLITDTGIALHSVPDLFTLSDDV